MTGQEKLNALKAFIKGKKHKSPDLPIKIIFSDGMEVLEITDLKQIPDFSILETEVFFDSPFIQYDFFVGDKKIKIGFIKEKEISAPVVQRQQQNQISNIDQLTEFLNLKKFMDQEVMSAQNKITEARLTAIQDAMNSKVENIVSSFEDKLRFKDDMYQERLKFQEEKIRLEYKNPRKEKVSAFAEFMTKAVENIEPETKNNFANLIIGIGQGVAKKYLGEVPLQGLTPTTDGTGDA